MSDLIVAAAGSMPVALLSPQPQIARPRRQLSHQRWCRELARQALRSLYQELSLYPKPGLVSLVDSGSHVDMNAATFLRSLFALRHYFRAMAMAGMQQAPFAELKNLALNAEARMLRATGGVNTHRGAIFCMGLLCAAMAACRSQQISLSAAAIRAVLLIQWGDALTAHAAAAGHSHGLQVALAHGVGGAREEGALGFPSVFEIALPQLQATLAAGRSWQCARLDALFALMAQLHDTNVYYRGGSRAAALVRQCGQAFMAAGGTAAPDWREQALRMHHRFVQQRLSPGGAADLLAAACLLHAVCRADAVGLVR